MTNPLHQSRGITGAALVSVALTLSGCAQGLQGLVSAQERDDFLVTGTVNQAAPTTALAALPRQAGRVLSVREQRSQDGLQQHIVLSGDPLATGENWIKVGVRNSRMVEAPSHHQLHTEMVSTFGGQALPLYNYILSNEHGPVGLAFGPISGQGQCAYIWQEVSQSDVQATDQRPFAHDAGVWTARVRLCRERLTQDHAIAFAQGLTLGAFSDPLYAPLASAPSNEAPLIDAGSLASLDAPAPTPTATRTARSTRAPERLSAVGTPVAALAPTARPDVPVVQNAVVVPAPGSAASRLPAAPSQASRPVQTSASSAPVNETRVAVPLPQ